MGTSTTTQWERILAGDIQPGDRVARTRTYPFTVAAIVHGPIAIRLLNEHVQTAARPRKDAKWWREVTS